jgi:hypothetical protein
VAPLLLRCCGRNVEAEVAAVESASRRTGSPCSAYARLSECFRVEWWGWLEVSYKSSLRGNESGGPREGISFPGAPLGLPMLSRHDVRDRGMEGVRGGDGGTMVVN